MQFRVNKHQQSIHFLFLQGNPFNQSNVRLCLHLCNYNNIFLCPLFFFLYQHIFSLRLVFTLTHASDDAVHRQPGGGVVEASDGQTFAVLLLLFEDEGRVLLLGDVDIVAGVSGGHDVAGARVQEDALVVLPLHPDQTHTIPGM